MMIHADSWAPLRSKRELPEEYEVDGARQGRQRPRDLQRWNLEHCLSARPASNMTLEPFGYRRQLDSRHLQS